jgi:DNA primase
MKVHVVTLPEGEDPDTFVLKHGRDRLEAQLSQAIDVFERKIQILQRGGWFADLRRKRVALDRLFPTIRSASDPISRELYLARTAEVVGVREDVLLRELRDGRAGNRGGATSDAASARPDTRVLQQQRRREFRSAGAAAERELVRLLLHRRQFVETLAERLGPDSFRDPLLSQIFRSLVAAPEDSLESLVMTLDDDAVALVNELSENVGGLEIPARMIEDCISVLRQRELGEEIDAIDREIPLADDSGKMQLVLRKQQLTKEINALGGRRWPAFLRSGQ